MKTTCTPSEITIQLRTEIAAFIAASTYFAVVFPLASLLTGV